MAFSHRKRNNISKVLDFCASSTLSSEFLLNIGPNLTFIVTRGFDEWNILFQKVENVMVIYKLNQFNLSESNSKTYNESALHEFYYAAKILEDMIEILQDENSKKNNKNLTKSINK